MVSESTRDGNVGVSSEGQPDVEVLVVDADTEYLIDLLDVLDRDADDVKIRTSRDVDETIDRLESGEVDCLVCTYQSGAGQGYRIMDYLRERTVEIPVVLLPAAEATIIDSRNLALDVTSVFLRDEAVRDGVLGPHLVNVVEQNRAAAEADRREAVKDVMQQAARDIAGAATPEAIEEQVSDRLAATSTFDGGWIATVDTTDGSVDPTAVAGDDRTAIPGFDDHGLANSLREAAQRAVRFDKPQVTSWEDATYGVVPVATDDADDRALGLCSDAKYAFREGEVGLLEEFGRTISRSIESIVNRQSLETRVDELELFEELIGQLGVGVVVYDADGRIEQVNEAFAALFDREVADFLDEAVWTVLPPRSPVEFDDYWASFEPGGTDVETVTFDDLDEGLRELVTTRVIADDEPYNATVIVEPAEDATLDSEFAAMLSYEFRHWLEIAEQAVREAEDGELRQLQLLDEIVDRMQDAIESEVATFAETDGQSGVAADQGSIVRLEPLLLGETARTAWNHVLGEAGVHEVKGSHAVYADEGLLLRLFEHLFRTLLHFADQTTAVDVGLTADGFYVEDNGSGTPHDDRPYVDGWESSPTTVADGAGILIATRAAERLGWSLEVTENDESGTRFVVSEVEWAAVEDASSN